ncbi:MAG: hypothetical protein CEE43_18035 [Promethearchaeota archaeon Loki_b32]|nr:MAG: hypothetical protein CEE43_18035 [Candidatus Lokiarchaeota archaeon Loki_b32]
MILKNSFIFYMREKKKKKPLRFFNEAVEYIDKFDTIDMLIEDNTVPLELKDYSSNFLRNEMLDELNNLSNIIKNNPDLKLKALTKAEKQIFQNFIKFYSKCPICGNLNHFFNLKRVFFDDDKKLLIKELIRLMTLNNRKIEKFKIQLGVPCCNCYKNFYEE